MDKSIIVPRSQIRLWVVIPEYNDWENIQQCLSSLGVIDSKSQRELEVNVLVISHGADKTCLLEGVKRFPNSIFMPGSEKEWWAATSNIGIKRALTLGATHIMLLNSDCKFEGTGFSQLLGQVVLLPNEIMAPQQVDRLRGTWIPSYFRPCLLAGFISLPRFKWRLNGSKGGEPLEEVFAIAGGRGVIIPSSAFFSIGLLDEKRFPHYYADHDFFLRCRKIPLRQSICSNIRIFVGESAAKSESAKLEPRRVWLRQKSMRSHLLYAYVSAFFKKHYPIRSLYRLGIFLFYFRTYLVRMTSAILKRIIK